MAKLSLIAAIVGALALAGCGFGDDTVTFEHEAFPFTFEYPDDLERDDSPEFELELGAALEEENVALGLDEDNALILQRFDLALEIDEDNLNVAKRELDTLLQRVDPEAADGEEGEIAGFLSLTYDDVTLPTPDEGESDYIALFEGDEQYMINCQSTPDRRGEIDAACDQVVATLTRE